MTTDTSLSSLLTVIHREVAAKSRPICSSEGVKIDHVKYISCTLTCGRAQMTSYTWGGTECNGLIPR